MTSVASGLSELCSLMTSNTNARIRGLIKGFLWAASNSDRRTNDSLKTPVVLKSLLLNSTLSDMGGEITDFYTNIKENYT